MTFLVWIGISFFWNSDAFARFDVVPGSRYTSARAAALGDAFLPLGDDGASALFYHPALIATAQRTRFELINIQGNINAETAGTFDQHVLTATSLNAYKNHLAATPGVKQSLGGAFLPNFFTRGVAVGVLAQTRFMAQPSGNNIVYRSQYLLIPTAAFAFSLARGIVRLGYSFQWVHKAEGIVSLPVTDTLGWNNNLPEGSAFSHNFGFSLTFPVAPQPAIDIVARNIGGARYKAGTLIGLANNANGLPPDENMSIDAAVSIRPKMGKGGVFSFVLQGRDITNISGTSILTRASAGMEWAFANAFSLRAGYRGGYPTVGVGITRPQAEFSLSWYSEELGQGFRENRDINFMLQYQMRLF